MSRSIAILGAGTQGTRLSYMWTRCGGAVNLIDRDPSQLRRATAEFDRFYSSRGKSDHHKNGKLTTFTPDGESEALKDAWLVIECVPESLKLKREIAARLDEITGPDVIIASNSSSYTITEIASDLRLKNPERLVSMHSYWPPETAALEIMGSSQTTPSIIDLLMKESAAHGFAPFRVRKNSMGYIYNRIWAAIKRESLLIAAEEVASPREVDEIFKEVLKTPKGPFEQMDVVGLDVVLNIEEHYAEERPELPLKPRELLKDMVRDSKLGVKSGQGFYKYS